jgi:transposase
MSQGPTRPRPRVSPNDSRDDSDWQFSLTAILAVRSPYLLARRVGPANEDDREELRKLSEEIQQATEENVELAYVDQGYTGERTSGFTAEHGIRLEVVKHEEAKRGFVLLPRRWVVERDFAWASRFRRLVKDYERLPDTVARLHFVAFACLFLQQAAGILSAGS